MADQSPEVGDRVRIAKSMTDETVYVLGHSWMDLLKTDATVFVVGDEEGNAMPLDSRALSVVERTDITRARAKRLRKALEAQLESPSQMFLV